jgi:phenylpropionate dioxygenase-like ring-hydroxylating dioxygenase large terminal subunit
MSHGIQSDTMSDEKGRYSITELRDQWYPLCLSEKLKAKPMSFRVFDTPVCVFRDCGRAVALLDRCAHRNVPLSLGKMVDGQLQCAYHGWRFDGGGVCRHIPALCDPCEGKARRVPTFAIREHQGLMWIYARPDVEPDKEPFLLQHVDDSDYMRIDYSGEFEATLYSTLENILDVPHTAFLHRGLFRGTEGQKVQVNVERSDVSVQAEYVGENTPKGIMGKLLAPGGGAIEHYDRFILPSIAQVEYRLGRHHIVVSSFCTPVSRFKTQLHVVVMAHLPRPLKMFRSLFMPIAMKVVKQDKWILKEQTRQTQAFGGEAFVSTPVDVLGPHILRILKKAERGEELDSSRVEQSSLEMWV